MRLHELIYLFNKSLRLNYVENKKNMIDNFPFIKMAYNKVVKVLTENFSDNEIITKFKINKLVITDNMKRKLCNILNSKIKKSDRIKINEHRLFMQLNSIEGIGKKKAYKLINLGISDVKDLKKREWNKLLSTATQILLKYEPLKKIPYELIHSLKKYIVSYDEQQINIVGGFLRKKSISKDIDIVFIQNSRKTKSSDEINNYIEYLKKYFNIVIYLRGLDKISLLIKLKSKYHNILPIIGGVNKSIYKRYIKMDIFITNKKEKYFAILYGIGSKEFNIYMRGIARKNGYILNQKN